MRILLVEDEEKLATIISEGLKKSGYAVDVLHDGQKAYDRISLNHMDYDLMILDLMLPGMDGESVTRGLRERSVTTPILILTARDEVDTKVNLLLSGADDYLVKPFSFAELEARMRALLRRPQEMVQPSLSASGVILDPRNRKVEKEGKEVSLTLKEFTILEYFMRNLGRVVNREELLSHVWDFNYSSFSNVVDVHVKNLRKKLGWDGNEQILETIRGVGYRLKG